MATVTVTLKTDVPASSKKAVQDLSGEFKGLSGAAAGLKIQFNDTFSVLKGVLAADVIKAGFNGLTSGAKKLFNTLVTDGVSAAQVQEDAVQKLNTALALAGDYSRDASEDMQRFASEMQKTTKVGDETTLQLLALAKTFGRSNEETKRLTQAAIELSAVTGMSLEGAIKNLGKTYAGLTGELGESLPALRNFTKEQLQAGAAVDFALQRFGGAAQGEIRTYSGATTQLGNTLGDLQEISGSLATQNSSLIEVIREATTVAEEFGDQALENNEALNQLVNDGLLGFIDGLAATVIALDSVGRVSQVAWNAATAAVKVFALGAVTAIGGPIALIDELLSKIPIIGDQFGQLSQVVTNHMKAWSDSIQEDAQDISRALDGPYESTQKVEEVLLRLREAAVRGAATQADLNSELERQSQLARDAAGSVSTFTEEQRKLADQGERLAQQLANQDPSVKYEAELLALEAALEQERILREDFEVYRDELAARRDQKIAEAYEKEARELLDQNRRLREIDELANNERIAENDRRLAEILRTEQVNARARERIGREIAASEAQVNRQRLQATQDILGQTAQLFGEHTAAYKVSASASAMIASFEGAIRAANAVVGVPIIGPGLAAAAYATFLGNGMATVAKINRVKLATGLTEVPAGYPNDTFPANLTSGERVINVKQNEDLKRFMSNNDGRQSDQLLAEILGVLIQMLNRPMPAVISAEDVFESVRAGIASGRRLSA